MLKVKNLTICSTIALFFPLWVPAAYAYDSLSTQELVTFLKNSDALPIQDLARMNDRLASNYVFNKVQSCFIGKFKVYADQQHDDEANLRKLVRFKAECRLKYFKEEATFQKMTNIRAKKEVEKLLSASADDITPDTAKAVVTSVMRMLPGSRYSRATQEILSRVYNAYHETYMMRRDIEHTKMFDYPEGIKSVEEALEKVDPVVVYRSAKMTILLTEEVWPKEPEIVRF